MSMLNIVIPMAGHGSRFVKAGYILPKPLIDVLGSPMIQLVVDNLRPECPHRFIFICQKAHIEEYALDTFLQKIAPKSIVLPVDEVTEGAACTVLLAKQFIDSGQPLMIANCDQYIRTDMNAYLAAMNSDLDGLIMTMPANDPKWSFVALNEKKLVNLVVEKKVISNEATVGIYNFRQGSDFVAAAETMIRKNLRVNNEFYVAPAYNELIGRSARIGIYNIGSAMYGLGIPEDLDYFVANSVQILN